MINYIKHIRQYFYPKFRLGFRGIAVRSFSVEDLEDYLSEIFKKRIEEESWKGVTHHTGFWEDGTEYEYWMINGVMTGRGGYEMFCKALKDKCNE